MSEDKHYYTWQDLAEIYGVGRDKAQKIIREIKRMQGGELALKKGKVLPRELAAWERGAHNG